MPFTAIDFILGNFPGIDNARFASCSMRQLARPGTNQAESYGFLFVGIDLAHHPLCSIVAGFIAAGAEQTHLERRRCKY